MSLYLVITLMAAEALLGELACRLRRSWLAARAVIADDTKARQLTEYEQQTLARIAGRPYPAAMFQAGQVIADDLRRAFPDTPDAELARYLLHARRVTGWQHAHGRNCVQITMLLGLAACDLTQIDREVKAR